MSSPSPSSSSSSSSSNMQKFKKLFKRKSPTTISTTTTPTPSTSPKTRITSSSIFASRSSTSFSSISSSNTSTYFSATSSCPSPYTPHFSSSPSTATVFAYSFSPTLSDASDAVDSRNRMDGLGIRSNSSSSISSLDARKTEEFWAQREEVGKGKWKRKGICGIEELNGNETGDDWLCW